MKKIWNKIIGTFKKFFLWVWKECRDWRTFVLLVIVCLVMGSPVWGGYLLALLFHWEWAFIVATAVFAFWWLPGMPFFALAVSVTLAIKKIGENVKKKRAEKLLESEAGTELLEDREEAENAPSDQEAF